ncbi:ABC transporter ATP-binding protein [Bacillus shivajii]|uniref:ABC transporter ATP-binding protein n=1 Tax=Bacillus shivajii TaxID=1983719 RepID=UPI001CFA0A36|nr:ABC transporter ATP-binding protein [Bacillus shivajii]UCZ51491.1 ABC transporter ATP-binding protein [Bacillus shivajii]
MIEFNGVTKTFPDGTEAIRGIDFKVDKGDFFVLIGPSGCGKTTTMKMINRLIDPNEGTIKINGENIKNKDIKKLRWNIGYVLQQIALFPHMTIEENIAVVPELKKWRKEDIRKRVDELLSMVGLDPDTYRNRKPSELSGGQQQRIGVIRALAGDPDIILMDEPFSALDPISREQLQKDIQDLQKKIQKTIIFVTHDMDEALALGNKVCLMKDGQVIQIDSPAQLIQNPANEFVKEFLGGRKDPLSVNVHHLIEKSSKWMVFDSEICEETECERMFVKDKNNNFLGIYNRGSIHHFKFPIHKYTTISEVLKIFKDMKLDVLPIVEENKLLGTVSLKAVAFYLEEQLNEGRAL